MGYVPVCRVTTASPFTSHYDRIGKEKDMEATHLMVFAALAVLFAAFDFSCAHNSFRQPEEIARYLGLSAMLAGIVTLAYFYSIYARSYRYMSVASSVYFACIDWMLVALVRFVYLYTRMDRQKIARTVRALIIELAALDSGMMLLNIFTEFVVSYAPTPDSLAPYRYVMKAPYYGHLIFTYGLVVLVVVILAVKSVQTPHIYRTQYVSIIAAIAVVVLVNAIFLFQDSASLLSQLDWSVFGYSIGLLLAYWAAFIFRRIEMPKALSATIFQNIEQGIVLFDHTDELILYNKKLTQLLPDLDFDDNPSRETFNNICDMGDMALLPDRVSKQFDRQGYRARRLRCDYSRLRNEQKHVVGNLYVLTDITEDIDLLTGFQHNELFKRRAAEDPYAFAYPCTAVLFDLLGLGEVNRRHGRETGDRRIQILADLMRQHMPENSVFIRGYEAHLIAVCENCTEADLRPRIDRVVEAAAGTVIFGIASMGRDRIVTEAIENASRSMHVKKLLSDRSYHSQKLSSLVRALQESDSDTEAHVQRTQKMGEELGKRIGLSDSELADLQLLCLLHDIGKIGIPLEILNKPGKLTDQEWAVLQTHPEKGYHIAMSSDELKHIAPMILSHHERWDGKGYPEKLAGQNIPILSRVISVVDSYDAMVNDRSYRKGRTPEQAQAEILRCAGSQFDPDLAREFLAMLEENPAIAVGEKTGGEEVRVFLPTMAEDDTEGNTFPIPFSRYLLDIDDQIVEVDSRFEELTGYTASEAQGRLSQFELIPPEDQSFYLLQVNKSFQRGSIAYLKHRLQRKDGTQIWVVCYGKRYFDSAIRSYRSEILIFQTTGGEE